MVLLNTIFLYPQIYISRLVDYLLFPKIEDRIIGLKTIFIFLVLGNNIKYSFQYLLR